MFWRRMRAQASREVAFAEWIAVSLAQQEVTAVEMIKGLYVTTPRLAGYWAEPRGFAELVRASIGMSQSRCACWRLLLKPGGDRALSPGMRAVRRMAEQLAERSARRSQDRLRGRGARPQIWAEHMLLAAVEVRGSGVSETLISSGLRLDLLQAAAEERC